jgi:hypothetical protein
MMFGKGAKRDVRSEAKRDVRSEAKRDVRSEAKRDVRSEGKSLIQALYQNSGNPTTRVALPSKALEDGSSVEEGSIVGDGNFGKGDRYDTGKKPDVALNDGNVVVEVHESQNHKTLWYHVGEVDGDKINWGESIKYDDGKKPSVAITNDGLVVEVHQSEKRDTLWYRVGQVDGGKIDWGESIEYDDGVQPSVAITNDRLVVEVHKSENHNTLWYRVGQVDDGKIDWGESIKYDDGKEPSVAITNDRLVVEVHKSQSHDTLWYHVGQVDDGKIDWGESIKYDDGVQPSVAITNDGLVVEVHKSGSHDTLWYHGTGQVNNNTIDWDNEKSQNYSDGKVPTVACNGQLAVEAHSEEGYLLCSVLTLPAFRSHWIELHGDNSYSYCVCNRATDNKHRHASNHTMNVKEGAPYLYAVLTKDDDSSDFPTGAIMTIEGPDGTKYDRDIEEENQLVIMSGSSVRCLIVKDPKPGDWTMTMTVPEGVGFHCECNTVPSKDPYKTITDALSKTNQLQKRGLDDDVTITGWLGAAATGAAIGAEIGLAGGFLGSLVGGVVGITAGNVTYLATTLFSSSPTPPLQTAATTLGQAAQANAAPPGEVRIATWNVFHGDLQNGNDPAYNQPRLRLLEDRVNELVNFGVQNNIGLITFQEMPQSVLNNPNDPILTNIRNSNYDYVIVNGEYPQGRAPASTTSDGYLILYNPAVFTLQNIAPGVQWEYFQPQLFLQGIAQARPPVRLRFQNRGANRDVFDFLTWHTEPQSAFAITYVQNAFNQLSQQQGNWILAGDLNIRDNRLPQGVVDPHHLTGDDQTLDHIITSGTAINPEENPQQPGRFTISQQQWGRFWSDAHYVLFGIVRF